jgi:hypothetical protein
VIDSKRQLRPRFLTGTLLSLAIACALPVTGAADSQAPASTAALISAHQRSLNSLLDRVPNRIAEKEHEYYVLSVLKSSVAPVIGWGHINAAAVSDGVKEGCWIMMLDEHHPWLEQPSPTLTTRELDGTLTIVVRPDVISEEMAGVFLVHELLHAYIDLYKPEIAPKHEEYQAYLVEKRALELMTNVDLDDLLSRTALRFALQSSADLIALWSNDPKQLARVFNHIEGALALPEPMSLAERQMRDGLYAVMLATQLASDRGLSLDKAADDINALLEVVSLHRTDALPSE